MSGLYLFATVAGTAIAIDTVEIEAVVKVKELSYVPAVPPHVAGLTALRSRVLTVLDAAALINGAVDDVGREYAIVCNIAGHSYGVLVDEVKDIVAKDSEPNTVRGRPDPVWSKYARGVLLHDNAPHFLISLGNLIENSMTAQAA
ncbi:chemotaxis protein CheW [Sphingobium subterraneum]|uniref:Purine-binding chemotaxis protein CheW n=1 Tax=Sphingobium subterraneum TaxID=627688 RepID=A0A841ITT3_9SPHN|nr:chemotaxis protein CheW [Sphingobium subterraneum]MBB6122319.1 purine-binding chemotaxis protein CheW [Sphingobium subterraneum]